MVWRLTFIEFRNKIVRETQLKHGIAFQTKTTSGVSLFRYTIHSFERNDIAVNEADIVANGHVQLLRLDLVSLFFVRK